MEKYKYSASKIRKRGYPQNLLSDLELDLLNFGEENHRGLEYIISLLDESEQLIIMRRYQQHQTYEAIAAELCVTRETIRKTVNRILKKLSSPMYSDYVVFGFTKANENREKAISSMIRPVTADSILYAPIEHLDLSNRAFNVLARAGCQTVGDVAKRFISCDLSSIRGLGNKCLNEITMALKDKGALRAALSVNEAEY